MNIFDVLQERGLIKQATKEVELKEALEGSISLYCGFDPTSDSLHVGSLLPIITLLRFKQCGHSPIALIGGATGMIGDPSFKEKERETMGEEHIAENIKGIKNQLESIIPNIDVVNNADWCKGIDMISFLRDVGKHFTINEMMRKESVKQRLNRDDGGISFTEFSYSLIQGLDFKHLFNEKGCQLQIGGSDQFGNMVAGLELISKEKSEKEAFVLTMPLVTKADGTKFGKTESGTVWLDPAKTSPFAFFQFWLNTSDEDIENFMMWFSQRPVDEIKAIMECDESLKEQGKKPLAQQLLAEEMVGLVHGEEALNSVIKLQNAFFKKSFNELNKDDLLLLKDEPEFVKIGVSEMDVKTLLVETGLSPSKSQSRRFIESGAIKIMGLKVDNEKAMVLDFETPEIFVIQRGKKNFAIVMKK